MAENGRSVPFALEAEQSVLGAILIDPEKFNEVGSIMTGDDFYLGEHKEIFQAMQELFIKNKEINLITLIDMLVSRGVYAEDEIKKYLRVIAEVVPSASNLKDYAQIVKDKSTLRKLIEASEEITESAYAARGEVKYILDNAEQRIFDVAQGDDVKNFIHIRDALSMSFDRLDKLAKDKDALAGTPTGFSGLDNVLVGMGKGDLILIGGRPGMGKTTFAVNIGTSVALRTKKTVCIFSLEMTAEQLVSRMLSAEAGVDSYAIRSGKLSEDDWTKLSYASSKLYDTNILIDDTSGMTVTGMKAKLRREKNVGLVIIDYLQLMQGERHSDNRVLEVGDISRGLKLLAKDIGAPVICCAQLSRGPENRPDKRPMLSDLRDSGAIEQDADVVMFIYRNEYYDRAPEDEEGKGASKAAAGAAQAECIIAKNRHGSTGNIKLAFDGKYSRFTTLETREEP
ncbi:MAG: replicative DNA helicase [Ruminococcus sp.]|nr:replicative DNA helicase [Candidatus Apopatosoma intestinale]